MTDFQKLWVGQAVSVFGSLITRTALPWCALLFLHARALDMALLVLADLLPGFLLGLFAGAWLDRRAKRPVMIACDVLRFLLVMSIPALALTGKLTLGSLFAVAPLMGILSTVFDIAYQSYLPELVQGEALSRANSRLSASAAVAEVCAFSVSGWLVQHFGGPQALLIDAATFLLSALSLLAIRQPNRVVPHLDGGQGAGLFQEAVEGLRYVGRQRLLRALALAQVALSFSMSLMGPLILLFMTRTLALEPKFLGMVFAVGGVTSLLGATFAAPLAQRFGVYRATALSFGLIPLGMLMIPLAPTRSALSYGLLTANQLLTDPGWTIFEIHQTTLRQQLAPEKLLGRVNAVTKVGGLGASLLGTLLAGVLGNRVGPRPVLFAGVGLACAAAILFARELSTSYPQAVDNS
ncbi:MFS transporter [Armatimonas sp.]|uniref:MFS transporter n=1 Tax=Armatimonas sp. TaxID=1872638 RepID=UPI00375026C3